LRLSECDLLFGSFPMKVSHSAHTDVGRTREHNEDSYGVGTVEQAEHFGELLVV
jgi:protein phosphatase